MAAFHKVSAEDALEVVRLFHAEYDRAMCQDVALGHLMIAGAFHAPGNDEKALLLRVGAQMCGMIRDDVYLDMFSGKTRLLVSSADASALSDRLDRTSALARYILVRWHDAAARIWYRIGNHTRAISAARSALELAEHEPLLWWCWGDIKSNWLRMRQEADKQVQRNASVGEQAYAEAIERAGQLNAEHPDAAREHKIEHLRGLWNLRHNWMYARGGDALEDSLAKFLPIRQALIELVGPGEPVDPYREAQTLNQEAIQLEVRALSPDGLRAVNLKFLDESIDRYRQLADMPWPRGRYFARQHLPLLLARRDPANHPQSVTEMQALCREVQSEQARPGGREGFDLDRYFWTVDLARKVSSPDETPFREHDLAVARAIQAIASVSTYKNAAQKFVLPSLQREMERCFPSEDVADLRLAVACLDRVIALVEEGSARELLDLLSVRRDASPGARAGDVFVPVAGLDPAKAFDGGTAGAGQSTRNRRASGTADEEEAIRANVGEQRNLEEEYWLGNPVPAQGIDPEISHYCRQFSADRVVDQRGPLLIRFFQRNRGYWSIAYFKGRTFGPFRLLEKLTEHLTEFLHKQQPDAPRPYHCDELWSGFFEPVLNGVVSPDTVDQVDRLIIVPCADLFSLPLHVATVPPKWTRTGQPELLGQWRPVAFSTSLSSHVLRNRAAFRSCFRQNDDDLVVLFAGEKEFRESMAGVLHTAARWHPGQVRTDNVRDSADHEAVKLATAKKPEFFVLQCHGQTLKDPLSGSVLWLHGGVLSSFGIATRQWLPRNKLTILGACVSGRPVRWDNGKGDVDPAGEIAGFIRGFIAAGSGALMVTNWSVRQVDLGFVTEQILKRIQESTNVLQLDTLLHEIVNAEKLSIKDRIERSVFQLYL